mgnify:FL=1
MLTRHRHPRFIRVVDRCLCQCAANRRSDRVAAHNRLPIARMPPRNREDAGHPHIAGELLATARVRSDVDVIHSPRALCCCSQFPVARSDPGWPIPPIALPRIDAATQLSPNPFVQRLDPSPPGQRLQTDALDSRGPQTRHLQGVHIALLTVSRRPRFATVIRRTVPAARSLHSSGLGKLAFGGRLVARSRSAR